MFLCPLTGLSKAARGTTSQSLGEMQQEGQRESCPFDRLATKLGLPTNCDIDLRKQEELEVTAVFKYLYGYFSFPVFSAVELEVLFVFCKLCIWATWL